jgi:hypothetical protein
VRDTISEEKDFLPLMESDYKMFESSGTSRKLADLAAFRVESAAGKLLVGVSENGNYGGNGKYAGVRFRNIWPGESYTSVLSVKFCNELERAYY